MERLRTRSIVVIGVLLIWAVRGVDLQHSDLVVQRTLSAVRRDPSVLPGDLIADHAAHHPGIWLDLLALFPDHSVLLAFFGLLASGLAAWLAHRLVRVLGGSAVAAGVVAVAVIVPRMLPGWVEVFPTAPTSRAMVVPLLFGSWICAVQKRPEWAGVCGGIACAVHPAVGGGATMIAAAWSLQPWRVLVVAACAASPIWLPVLVWGLPASGGLEWWDTVRARWGHHLVAGDGWSGCAAGVVLVGSMLVGLRGQEPRVRRVGWIAFAVMMVSGFTAMLTVREWLPSQLARLHPWHWWVGPTFCLLVLGGVQISARPRGIGVAILMLAAGLRPSLAGWRGASEPPSRELVRHLERVSPDRPLLMSPGQVPWVRLDVNRSVVVSIKDGAEVISDPVFATRWTRRVLDVCGLSVLPTGTATGWERIRAACVLPQSVSGWASVARRYRAAAICLPRGVSTEAWTVIAACGSGHWVVEPWPSERRPPAAIQ